MWVLVEVGSWLDLILWRRCDLEIPNPVVRCWVGIDSGCGVGVVFGLAGLRINLVLAAA